MRDDEQALRTDEEHGDHGGEGEGVAIRPQLEREVRLQSDEDRAEDVAAHNGTAQAADPAEHRGHEREEQGIRADVG